MSRDHRVFIHAQSFEILPKTGRRREAVLAYLNHLKSNAHLGGGASHVDPVSSRTYQVSTVSGFAITWWVDEAAMEVKVVDIRESH